MDQNQWFNTGSPAPMNDRQAFEAGWTASTMESAPWAMTSSPR